MIRNLKQLVFGSVAMLCSTAVWAVPFEVTTVNDGQFADGTTWYTITNGSSRLLLTDTGTDTKMSLASSLYTGDDSELWCFTGNDADGYKIYNKKAGATRVLASPTTMTNNGGGSYPVMTDESALTSSVTALYDFESSDKIAGEDGYFIGQHGSSSNFMNNFGGNNVLAFWTGGKDAGSTFLFEMAEKEMIVAQSTGSFTATNPAGTWASNWKSSATDPELNVNCGVNNMCFADDAVVGYGGLAGTSTYTISAGAGYVIKGFSFDYSMHQSNSMTITAYGNTYTTTSTDQPLVVTGLKDQTAQFTVSGGNYGVVMKNFKVIVARSAKEPETQFNVFPTKAGEVVHRIPAVATASDGTIVVAADYRYSGSDIGMVNNGKLDLRYRYSTDNGVTWSDIMTLVAGKGSAGVNPADNDMWVAFGDPILVADRNSNNMMALSCCGNVSFPSGTSSNHQGIARFYSKDNGKTWEDPEDIAPRIYALFDGRKGSPVAAMFIGSGKMTQSQTTKVGEYYRVYNAGLVKLNDGTYTNFVFYSDDFGATWKVLGGADVPPIPSGGDEPKAEELPDGSILISSRVGGGRKYNIYSFTNTETGEGSWGTVAFSGSSNNGVVASSNSCNGEVLVLPATRNEDGKTVYIVLQSVPFGPSDRSNVGINYKELESLSDFVDPATFSADWDGKHQASYIASAYSTMTLQNDNTIGFVYEECTFGPAYTIVYKNYTLEDITDGDYSYNADADRDAFVAAGIDDKMSAVLDESKFGDYVGQFTAEAKDGIDQAVAAYKEAPSKALYEAINKAIADAPKNEIKENYEYRLANKERSGNPCLTVGSDGNLTGATKDEADDAQLFTFVLDAESQAWSVYSPSADKYIANTPAIYNRVPLVEETGEVGKYVVNSTTDGLSNLACVAPANGNYPALHLDGYGKIVPWTTTEGASLWYIEPVKEYSGVATVGAETESEPELLFDLFGRRVITDTPAHGIYVTSTGRKVVK